MRLYADRFLGAALSLTLLGCSTALTGGVPIGSNEWGEYSLLVRDLSGIVTEVRGVQGPPGGPDGAIADPERLEIRVAWTGGACSHQPVLVVVGSAKDLILAISNPHDPQLLPFLPVSCPAVGIPLQAVVALNEPVAQDAIDFTVTY
jgi:hypothetical protein